jgi:hypothetical protein
MIPKEQKYLPRMNTDKHRQKIKEGAAKPFCEIQRLTV